MQSKPGSPRQEPRIVPGSPWRKSRVAPRLPRTRRRLATVLLATISAVTVPTVPAQNARQELSAESAIESIKRREVIKIGLSLFMPWSMRDRNGELIGFEIDVGRKLAEDMGVDAEFVPTSWDGIVPALVAGKFDTIISGLSVTPQRNLTVNFTEPYAYSGGTMLANRQLTEGFLLADFNSPDVTLTARRGATTAVVAADRFPRAELLLFDEDGATVQEVLNGNAHATISKEPTPSREARRYPDTLYVPFDILFNQTGEAFAIRKGDPDALNFFNHWIANHWRSGWLQERHDYWFTTEDWADQVVQ